MSFPKSFIGNPLPAFRFLSLAIFLLLPLTTYHLPLTSANPNPQWSAVQKKIAVQSGTSVSAWELTGRADMTEKQYGMAGATMTAEGDGTYSLGLDLFPGGQYNYTFFATKDGNTYWDTVVTNGSSDGFTISMSSTSYQSAGSGSAIYTAVAGGDARRVLTVPSLPVGSTVYVMNNFGGAPQAPVNVNATPGQSSIRLKWSEPATPWGNSGSMRPFDVLIGGGFRVFRSTDKSTGYQDIGATLQANSPTVLSNGLIAGTTASITYDVVDLNPVPKTVNYYIIVSSDAYTGAVNSAEIANLTSGVPGIGSTEQVKGRPGRPVEIWFKVQGADEEKIKEKEYLVWLTPEDQDARFYTHKIAGRMIAVYMPGSDELPSQIQSGPENINLQKNANGDEGKVPSSMPLKKVEVPVDNKKEVVLRHSRESGNPVVDAARFPIKTFGNDVSDDLNNQL